VPVLSKALCREEVLGVEYESKMGSAYQCVLNNTSCSILMFFI